MKNYFKNKIPILELKAKGKLIISSKLSSQINQLHKEVGKNEWSGVLVYDQLKGKLDDPSGLILKAEGLYLMDIGTTTSTSFEIDEDILDIYKVFPKLDPIKTKRNRWRQGLIHSHHGMDAYFSSTDDEELMDNSEKYDYYLSLIVNFNSSYKAVLAFIANREIKYPYKKNIIYNTEKVLVKIPLDIVFENNSNFFDRFEEINKKKVINNTVKSYPNQHVVKQPKYVQTFNNKTKLQSKIFQFMIFWLLNEKEINIQKYPSLIKIDAHFTSGLVQKEMFKFIAYLIKTYDHKFDLFFGKNIPQEEYEKFQNQVYLCLNNNKEKIKDTFFETLSKVFKMFKEDKIILRTKQKENVN